MCCKSNDRLNIRQMEHAIRRNFGGFSMEGKEDIVEIFMKQVKTHLPTSMPEKSCMKKRLKNCFRDEFKNNQANRDQLYTIFLRSWRERIRNDLEGPGKQVDDELVQQYCSHIFQQKWLEGRFDSSFQEEYEKQYNLFFEEKFEKEVKASTLYTFHGL